MNNVLQRLNIKTARALLASFYSASVAIHVLVISKIIPYTWVNGGMSKSYEVQAQQSAISMLIIGMLFLYVWVISTPQKQKYPWQTRSLYVVAALLAIGFILQLLGTPFERYVMSIILAIGITSHLRLAAAAHQKLDK